MCKPQNLEDYIKQSGLRISVIVEKLGISRQAFFRKRHFETRFTAKEVYILCDLLMIPQADVERVFFLPLG